MYKDENGHYKREIKKWKIVETEIFSVETRIKIIIRNHNYRKR